MSTSAPSQHPQTGLDEVEVGDILFGSINRDNVHGLNLTVPEDARAVIKPWNERDDTEFFAESGVDDQVILHIPFTQAVRLRAILLKTARGEYAPRRLRVYANFPNIIDFSDAEGTRPHLDISLLEETAVTEYPLRVAAFANSDASGGEVTRLYYVGFKGDTRSAKKDATDKLEIPAANAADAPLVDRVGEKSGAAQTTAR